MRDPVEAYFTQLRDIYASGAGVAETSYYGPLATLLTDIGTKLKPKVTAIINLRNTGGGIPDGGLFTALQLKGWDPGTDPLQGQLPARGAIEVKGTTDDAFQVAASEQVARYVERYGLVLVTNLRDFVLVGRSADGSGVRELESCRLATNATSFWAHIAQPHKFAEEASEGLTEFLRRVLLHNAPLSDPKDIAWFLASYARTARLRLESRHDLPALDQLRGQLEESLGLKFEGEKGDHFFRSTLVQTLFYGMFASWVLWARDKSRAAVIEWRDRFQWETASQTLHVPMVAELFYQFSNPGRLRDLHIDEVLEWAEEVLWRIDRESFFEKFQEEHAVQYFYEPFLEAFDPQLRKELGVWYTPDEIVKYMVARVDWALREELGIADGLADPSVVVLDPCCGTGAYLVEVLRKIDETLQAKGADALTRQDVKRAAMERVIGFEIMPAPFVVAHLQMGILLADLRIPLKDDERAAVYLTNALTGWGDGGQVAPPKDKRVHPEQMHSTLLFPEFAEERDAADRVKREERVLVVIGNPPYNSYAGTSPTEEEGLVDAYKVGLASEWGIKKFNLDDLYVRFFRLAERQIAERCGRGVVCLISNFSWLSGPSYVVMRQRLLREFDGVWVDNMNGDSRETGKTTHEGLPDPSVFSTEKNREGIRVGTAIATLIARVSEARPPGNAVVRYREFWGQGKRAELVSDRREELNAYELVDPQPANRFSLRPLSVEPCYLSWPSLTDLAEVAGYQGLSEDRRKALMDPNRDALVVRMRSYFDAGISWAEYAARGSVLSDDYVDFDAASTRGRLLAKGYDAAQVRPYSVRPFDDWWCYYSGVRPLWRRHRPDYWRQAWAGNAFLVSRLNAAARDEGLAAVPVSGLCDYHCVQPNAVALPFMLRGSGIDGLFDQDVRPNLSVRSLAYLKDLGLVSAEPADTAGAVWLHAIAMMSGPGYLAENADGVRTDWPRIPLPRTADVLRASSRVGAAVASLLAPDLKTPIEPLPLVTHIALGTLSSRGGQLDPSVDLAVTARWGIAGKGGITMPSTGKLAERGYTAEELAAIAEGAATLGMSGDQAIQLLGETCFDIYLNDVAYWSCVPANVWRYTIGGYQVIKKWLSYRERPLLGRDLKSEEARYVTEMVRRIVALVLMQPELDANYERVKADVREWGKTGG